MTTTTITPESEDRDVPLSILKEVRALYTYFNGAHFNAVRFETMIDLLHIHAEKIIAARELEHGVKII